MKIFGEVVIMKIFGEVEIMNCTYFVSVFHKEGIVGFTCISKGIQLKYFDDYNDARDCMRQLFSEGMRKLFLFKWDAIEKCYVEDGRIDVDGIYCKA